MVHSSLHCSVVVQRLLFATLRPRLVGLEGRGKMSKLASAFGVLYLGSVLGACSSDSNEATTEITVTGLAGGLEFRVRSGAFGVVGGSLLSITFSDGIDICKDVGGETPLPNQMNLVAVQL